MRRFTSARIISGSALALLLAWAAGPGVASQTALSQGRGGGGGCTTLDCPDNTCGTHCEQNANGSCTYDINNIRQCGTGTQSACQTHTADCKQ